MAEVQSLDPHLSLAARIQAYAGALAMVAVSTLVDLWIAPRWGTAAVDMIYLPGRARRGRALGDRARAALRASRPRSLQFLLHRAGSHLPNDRVADVVTVVILLIVALVTSRLASGIRAQARLLPRMPPETPPLPALPETLSCSTEERSH